MNEFLNKINEISIQCKYTCWYNKIIQRGLDRVLLNDELYENHHIFPVSFNEEFKNENNNIVRLTIREHYIVHVLLSKMFIGEYQTKMIRSLFFLNSRLESCNSRFFQSAKSKFSSYMKENNPLFSSDVKEKIRKALTGRTAETHEYIMKANQKKRLYNASNSDWVRISREKFANTVSLMTDEERKIKFGHECSTEQREKFRVERKGKNKNTCERVKRMSNTILAKNKMLSPEELKEKYTRTLGMKWYHNDDLKKSKLMSPDLVNLNEWALGRKRYEN